MMDDPTLQQDLAAFEAQAREIPMERIRQFRAPRPSEPLDEGEVEVLADALEGALAFLSGGEVQRGGNVAFEVEGALEKGKLSPSLFAGLTTLSEFLESVKDDHPELGAYAFDAEDVAKDREAMIDAIDKLMSLQQDQRAQMRLRVPVRASEEAPPEEAPVEDEAALEDLLK